MDSHANTFVAGSNTRLISMTGKEVNIHSFTTGAELKTVPIASIATVFIDTNGNRILLVVHQALYLGDKHAGCLVNPNQLCSYSLAMHDCPSQFDSSSQHSIYSPQSNMHIPLQLDGIISFFESCQPTDEDMVSLPHVVLTSVDEWDPYSTTFTEKEEVARRCAVVAKEQSHRLRSRLKLQGKIAKDLRDLQCFILWILTLIQLWKYVLGEYRLSNAMNSTFTSIPWIYQVITCLIHWLNAFVLHLLT
jgi:hypothetical protein